MCGLRGTVLEVQQKREGQGSPIRFRVAARNLKEEKDGPEEGYRGGEGLERDSERGPGFSAAAGAGVGAGGSGVRDGGGAWGGQGGADSWAAWIPQWVLRADADHACGQARAAGAAGSAGAVFHGDVR